MGGARFATRGVTMISRCVTSTMREERVPRLLDAASETSERLAKR